MAGSSITRDIKLLVAGALISFCSTICVSYLNNTYSEKKELVARRYLIAQEIAKGLQLRAILINDLYNAKNDLAKAKTPANQLAFDNAYKISAADRQSFESASIAYFAQLNILFKPEDEAAFRSLYSKMVELNLYVELDNDKYVNDKTYAGERVKLENAILPFAERLYEEIEQTR